MLGICLLNGLCCGLLGVLVAIIVANAATIVVPLSKNTLLIGGDENV